MTTSRSGSRAATPGAAGSRRRRAAAALASAVVAVTAFASILTLAPAAPVPADAPATEFSAARAVAHIERISGSPRTIGSTAHADAREYLVGALTSFGWEVAVQETVGVTDWGVPGSYHLADVANVVAALPGTAPTGTVLLAAHYDTVAGSPGAADDGAGVGAVLETARALRSDAARQRNDVVILLSDGEEIGLAGAEAFVREHAAGLGETVVLNHEARGSSGTPMTFRMTSPNGGLLDVLSAVPGVLVDSSTEATFEALPNDTDYRHFEAAGMHAVDTALIGGSASYHSPLDDVDRLSPASVQQMGQTTLALSRRLGEADLRSLDAGGEDLATTGPWGSLRYPAAAEVPLAAGTLALTVVLLLVARWRRELTLPRTSLALAAALACLAGAGVVGFAVWQIALAIDPGQASAVVGNPYQPAPYQVAILLAALAVVVVVAGPARHRLGSRTFALASLVLSSAAGVLLALALPGTSMAIVLPTLAVVASSAVAAALPGRWSSARGVVVLVGVLTATVLLAPAIWIGFDVGLGLGGPTAAVFMALLLLLAVPLADVVRPASADRRKSLWRALVVPGVAITLAAAATAAGLVVNREGATPARQESLQYVMDADNGQAHWMSWVSPRSPWSRSLMPAGPESLDGAAPWAGGSRLVHGPAPAARDLSGPRVEVLDDEVRGSVRELTLRLSSTRGAPTLGLWVDAGSATLHEASVQGRDLPVRGASGQWDFGFLFSQAAREGVEVRLELDPGSEGPALRVVDRSDDLADAPDLVAPHGRRLVAPHVFVTRQVTL